MTQRLDEYASYSGDIQALIERIYGDIKKTAEGTVRSLVASAHVESGIRLDMENFSDDLQNAIYCAHLLPYLLYLERFKPQDQPCHLPEDPPEDSPFASAFHFFGNDPETKGYADDLFKRIHEGATEIFVDQLERAIITASALAGDEASDEDKRRVYRREIRDHVGSFLAHIGKFNLQSNLEKIQKRK